VLQPADKQVQRMTVCEKAAVTWTWAAARPSMRMPQSSAVTSR
jgi:hypothetical protein